MATKLNRSLDLESQFYEATSAAERMECLERLTDASIVDRTSTEAFLAKILTSDVNPIVRHEAAFTLGRLRSLGQVGDSVASFLCKAAFNDASLIVQHEATEALHAFDGEIVDRALSDLLQEPNSDIRLTAEISVCRRNHRLAEKS